MQDEPAVLVRQGYDVVAQRYLAWAKPSPTRARYLELLRQLLPAQGRILEIGCGAGVPVARDLAAEAEVVGVDISATQIALARQAVHQATFIAADITQMDFPPATFDAVVSFYAILHIPRALHAELFTSVARWLRPGGVFVASLGAQDSPDMVEADWLGVPMFFSHFDAATTIALLRQAGLHLTHAEVVAEDEDGVAVPFLWVLAQHGGDAPYRPS
ncbi:MAG: class I SAM-dependent methyltransferase [Ktedonobacterales bacterium]|nr:class I SAM-dependent methyltransferase [Ktedonobacterales bacterium]